jgi:hypothetical protein
VVGEERRILREKCAMLLIIHFENSSGKYSYADSVYEKIILKLFSKRQYLMQWSSLMQITLSSSWCCK